MKLPDEIFGQDVEGALERYLEGSQKSEETQTSTQPRTRTTSIEGINLADYIFLPQHNLYVAKETSYHGNDWYQAHDALHNERARMLTIREFVDFLELLKSGNVMDGLEQRLPENEVIAIYDNITEKRDPQREEWLDAGFKDINGVLHINYYHSNVNGQLQPQNSEPLETCVMEDGYVDLFSANRQGLPTQKSRNEDFHYRHPRNECVAGFYVSSDSFWVGLGCYYGDPEGSSSVLGVRATREKKIIV